MRKLIALVLALVFVLGLAGCSGKEVKIWEWMQNLTPEDLASAEVWSAGEGSYEYEPLDDGEILELATLLNKLTKDSFTENKHLVGITPVVGINMTVDSEVYHLNYSPSPNGEHGMLEIGYGEKQWWIDHPALLDYFLKVIDGKPTA